MVSCSCAPSKEDAPEAVEEFVVSDPLVVKPPQDPITWPLTGQAIVAGDDIKRRPISVKIENTPIARPQLGISHADVIYESVTEGGITRLNCIFQSDIPVEFGPVRSARNSDVSIVPQYQAMFFYSGANSTVNAEIANAGIDNMGHTPASDLYYRVDYREAPHNLYVKTKNLYDVATNLGYQTTLDNPPSLVFGSYVGQSPAANKITVPLSDSYVANWDYDATEKSYVRSMGEPSTDAESGQAITAANVVILWSEYRLGVVANNSQTYNVDLTASGNASIFRDGMRIDGTWEATVDSPPRFKDASGQEIKLASGKTWFEVVNSSVIVASS